MQAVGLEYRKYRSNHRFQHMETNHKMLGLSSIILAFSQLCYIAASTGLGDFQTSWSKRNYDGIVKSLSA
jgi:hypothetical protein